MEKKYYNQQIKLLLIVLIFISLISILFPIQEAYALRAGVCWGTCTYCIGPENCAMCGMEYSGTTGCHTPNCNACEFYGQFCQM